MSREVAFNIALTTGWADRLLAVDDYVDASLNGLQVDAHGTFDLIYRIPELRAELAQAIDTVHREWSSGATCFDLSGSPIKIAVAVDAGRTVIDEAIDRVNADLLIVHHGLFWGQKWSCRDNLGAKVRKLIQGGCSLYAAHLPLDGDLRFGNGVGVAEFLSVSDVEPFFEYQGSTVGVRGSFERPMELVQIEERLSSMVGYSSHLTLPFGVSKISTVGIVTGSGSMAISDASRAGLDLLISGESKQEAFHLAQELGQNVIFAGHYATETFGVVRLGERLAEHFGGSFTFIDQPTGI